MDIQALMLSLEGGGGKEGVHRFLPLVENIIIICTVPFTGLKDKRIGSECSYMSISNHYNLVMIIATATKHFF